MSQRPLVSIVSIAYNQEKYIRAALDGMVMQRADFPFEVIIADDASTDATPKIISEYAKKYPDIVRPILRKKNLGAIANSVATLREASGKYLALCEGDDYWLDMNKLQKQVDLMEGNPNYALCFHPIRVFFDNGSQEDTIWPSMKDERSINLAQLLRENFIPTSSVMYRRQNYKHLAADVMPFDWYLHVYHMKFGEAGFLNEVMSTYRRHQGSLWWDTLENQTRHWKRYAVQHAAMYMEFFKLYGVDDKLRSIICDGAGDVVENLLRIDSGLAEAVLDHVMRSCPEMCASLVLNRVRRLEERSEELRRSEQQLAITAEEVIGLSQLRDELYSLKNARVLGRIIKLRNHVGNAYKLLHRIAR